MKHRRAVGESGRASPNRPPIKGRFSKRAEQLRNWLGEYLIAKYEQTLQVYPMSGVLRYDSSSFLCFAFLRLVSVLTDGVLMYPQALFKPVCIQSYL